MRAIKGLKLYQGRTIAVLTIALSLFLSCSGKNKNLASSVESRDSASVMTTVGMSTLVSENGQIKYRMEAEDWQMFDRKQPSYWAFEKGAYLEVLDSLMEVSSSVRSDTAYYFDKEKKWELRGNVHAENVDGEQFDTQIMFWDQNREKVWSDDRIVIRQEQQVIYGMGFESNQDFTRYTIKHTEGMFPVEN